MTRYLLTQLAQDDLTSIKNHISKHSSETARRVVRELRILMVQIATSPTLGRRLDWIDPRIRVRVHYSYLIIYRSDVAPIHILRVVHGAMNLVELRIDREL